MTVVKALLVAAGGLLAATAIVSVGLWDVPGRLVVPAALLAAALALAVLGIAIRRGWPHRSDLPLSIVFYGWLYVVPFLLGVGLLRRVLALSFVLPIEDSVSYADRTDNVLTAGLVLNAVLPIGGLLAAVAFQRRRWRLFAGAIGGAVLLFVLVGLAAAMSSAPLFGQETRIVKP